MLVIESEEPELYARVQNRNLIRQYDLLTNCVEIGLRQGSCPTAWCSCDGVAIVISGEPGLVRLPCRAG
jgi:hypothetical protein